MKLLSDRFEFDTDAVATGDEAVLQGTLWRVYDNANGSAERRLRTWKKTGTDIDDDLRSLWRHEMRQVRRLMRSRDASDLIVDVIEELEDDQEFALLLADRGEPVAPRVRRGQVITIPVGRKRILLWQNISRVARALGILHDQAIIHGRLSLDCIFSTGGNEPDFRLSGFEWSVRLGSEDDAGQKPRSRSQSRQPCSFRADWAALGEITATLLGESKSEFGMSGGAPSITELESGVLSLLRVPRPNQALDSQIVARSIEAVISDLQRLESGRRGQLILFPDVSSLALRLTAHLGEEIDPDNFEAHCRWIQEDLSSDVRVAARFDGGEREQCELVTNSFRYIVEPMRHATDWRVGFLKTLIPNNGRGTGTAEPRQLDSPVQVYSNRKEAIEAARRLGTSAIEWDQYAHPTQVEGLGPADVRDALLAIEVIEAVAATLDAFPVTVVDEDIAIRRLVLQLQSSSDHQALEQRPG